MAGLEHGRVLRRIRSLLVLAAAMALLLHLEHLAGLHRLPLQLRSFSVLPLLAGILWLTPRQELLLGLLFLASTLGVWAGGPAGLIEAEFLLRSLARALLVGLCVLLSRQRQRLITQAAQLKQQLVIALETAAVVHEIRQPLTLIQLESRRLLRQLEQQDAVDPVWRAGLDTIQQGALQLAHAIAAITALIRGSVVGHRSVDLCSVLRGELETERSRLDGIGAGLCIKGLGQPQILQGDAVLLGIAAANLLRNALDALEFLDSRGRRLRLSLQHQGDQLVLVVADSGPGLPPALEAPLIRRSAKPQGMGLGLMLVHAIAAAHGGELQLGRCPQLGGAELRLRLPVCR